MNGKERTEVLRFATAPELASAAASRWLDLVTANTAGAPWTVALSGGRIAGQFFSTAAQIARERRVSLADLHFFWSDERCVPPDDQESNFRLANDLLLLPLQVPAERVHRIRGELDPNAAAESAAADLRRLVKVADPRQPVLDLVFLGMGEDGHTASLFPQEGDAFVADERLFRAVQASKPPPARVTMGYLLLAAARQVWVLVSGAGKRAALDQSLAGPSTPLGRLLNLRKRTLILTDALG